MKIKKILVATFAAILLLTACSSPKETEANKIATILETKGLDTQMTNTPFDFGSGDVDPASLIEFYTNLTQNWQDMLEAGSVPVQYEAGVSAQHEISKLLGSALKDGKITSTAFVGDSTNGEASGLFIYHFADAAVIPGNIQDLLVKANAVIDNTKSGEYYFVQGNFFVAYDYGFTKDRAALTEILTQTIPVAE